MALFVVLQTYASPELVARYHTEHIAWIEGYAQGGVFLLAGQTEPVGGSVILIDAPSREDVERFVAEDALVVNGIVTATNIVEFRPRRGSLRISAVNPLFAPDRPISIDR
jgi:uncharacterized protein YciI